MPRHFHRRKVERIRLFPPIAGQVGDMKVDIVELSLRGARLHHYRPLQPGYSIPLRFEWHERPLLLQAEVIRTSDERFGPATIYTSGLQFTTSDSSFFVLQDLICAHVEDALDRQVANASGDDSRLTAAEQIAIYSIVPGDRERATTRIRQDRDEGYVRYTLAGGTWERVESNDNGQPHDGFTIWSFEDDEQAGELCRIYESSNEEVRSLIRICAELSLFVDDDLTPQDFDP